MEGKTIFLRTVRADLKVGFGLSFLFSVFGIVLCFCFDNWQDLQNFFINPLINKDKTSVCVMYYFFNSFSFGGVFTEYFSAIMSAIPFATNYCQENAGGMEIYKYTRCGKVIYARSKFLVTSILGGLTASLGGLIFILLLASYIPIITPEQYLEISWLPFSKALTVGNGALYFVIVLYISFLGGALWGSIGLCASAYFTNIYVTICAPFIFRFLLVQLGRMLMLPSKLRLDLLLAAREIIISDVLTFILTTVFVLLLIIVCYNLFLKQLERRMWDVDKNSKCVFISDEAGSK